ncbi:intradiol ring-cleavage dioxygenase [Aquabacterium sp. J223]|uniref:intradiol ring-cleavage dioxygenase n=1 Tax=Aquabacterium sp. J223 TaxID=2898431 RepID=UPI0021ADAF2B|nr:intradiol ring-cleavage dioxygenase [Aquabacterium sp. J223]UUX97116.1 intradiol ring-cleavage dioxygenase [Aquabacterium sp. J223]
MNEIPRPDLLRRRLLATGGAVLAPVAAVAQAPAAATTAARLPLTAQTTEGPYYLDGMPLRSDITEGLPGVPLEIVFTVRDADGRPLKGCRVDVWQCDAAGRYSGYAGQGDDRTVDLVGKTFLRGGQVSDDGGEVRFRSVYPGWYPGRTTHVHMKVLNDGAALLTSQFFLPDGLNEFLYTQTPQYRRRGVRDVVNRTDGIALRAGESVIGAVQELPDRYVARLTLVVDPQGRPSDQRPGMPMPPALRTGSGRRALPPAEGAGRVGMLVPGPTKP